MNPQAYRSHFGLDPPDISHGARLAVLRLAVRDLSAAVAVLKRANVPAAMRMGRIVIGPQAAHGGTIVLEPG